MIHASSPTPIPPRISAGRCKPNVIRDISMMILNPTKIQPVRIIFLLLYLYHKIRVVSAITVPTAA